MRYLYVMTKPVIQTVTAFTILFAFLTMPSASAQSVVYTNVNVTGGGGGGTGATDPRVDDIEISLTRSAEDLFDIRQADINDTTKIFDWNSNTLQFRASAFYIQTDPDVNAPLTSITFPEGQTTTIYVVANLVNNNGAGRAEIEVTNTNGSLSYQRISQGYTDFNVTSQGYINLTYNQITASNAALGSMSKAQGDYIFSPAPALIDVDQVTSNLDARVDDLELYEYVYVASASITETFPTLFSAGDLVVDPAGAGDYLVEYSFMIENQGLSPADLVLEFFQGADFREIKGFTLPVGASREVYVRRVVTHDGTTSLSANDLKPYVLGDGEEFLITDYILSVRKLP